MRTALIIGFSLIAVPAAAHTAAGGFAHPFAGADHLLAMLAVGLWAGLVRGARVWIWPAAFVTAVVAGMAAAGLGLGGAGTEAVITISLAAMGAAIALRLKAPLVLGAAVIALFGAAHGAAHGQTVAGGGWREAGGFVAATILLHAAGLGIALAARRFGAERLIRAGGAGLAVAGLLLAATG